MIMQMDAVTQGLYIPFGVQSQNSVNFTKVDGNHNDSIKIMNIREIYGIFGDFHKIV